MTNSSQPARPTFLWQGTLLLLPVIIFAALGAIFLKRERASVVQEARENARGLASQIAAYAGPHMRHEFYIRYYHALQNPNLFVPAVNAPWSPPPGTKMPINFVTPEYRRFISAITNFGHGAMTAAADQPRLIVDKRGTLLWPTPYQLAPVPDMPDASTSGNTPALAALRQFQSGQVLVGEGKSSEALELFARLATNASPLSSESGLPLQPLAHLEKLRLVARVQPAAVGNAAAELAVEAVARPSILTPVLLDEAVHASPHNKPDGFESDPVHWRQIWWMQEESRAFHTYLLDHGMLPFKSHEPTIIPIVWRGHPWFAVRTWDVRRTGNSGTEEPLFGVQFYPAALLDLERVALLSESGLRVPPYAEVTFEVGGYTLPVASTNTTLGEAEMVWEDIGRSELAGLFRVESKPLSGLQVRVNLAKPELMFAMQRRREMMFCGLIVGALATALIGWVAAYRAFRRQLSLNEMKSNFVSSVSHELRAPIASVRLMAESLERGKISGTEKQSEYFRFIGQECRRLSSLIENVLDFSRIEQGRKQYEFEPTNLQVLVEQTVRVMEPYAAEKGIKLETSNIRHPTSNIECGESTTTSGRENLQPSTSNLELNVDGRAIQQALVNLIDNAIKHSPKGQTVTVGILDATRNTQHDPSLNHQPSTINLFVSDHGEGIPQTEHEKIFERFYRLGSELRRETQGVGIGLSIVKHIVEAHDGCVRVESEPGKGSRFTIELPVNRKI